MKLWPASLISMLVLALLAGPLATEAQPARTVPRIGVLVPVEPASHTTLRLGARPMAGFGPSRYGRI
jgi:hypothetical protein